MRVGTLVIEQIASHRNGICGASFHVVLFSEPAEERRMIGIVFEEPYHVAVFDRRLLARDEIGFARGNSWRGDHYEGALREAIKVARGTDYMPLLVGSGLMYRRNDDEPLTDH